MSTDTSKPTYALSIRAPWWWFILHAGKDIENRDWATNLRGRVYIHASKSFNKGEATDDYLFAWRQLASDCNPIGLPSMRDFGGHIVGSVEITGCTRASTSKWFFGPYGLTLRDPVVFADPVPCKGMLGLFKPDPAVVGALP